MAVGEGKFVLYSRIEPPLEAGDYRFTASQNLTAAGHGSGTLPVAELPTHVTVRSPRYALPPDQVLSTFPPAGSEGSYGSRLPQVVIRRRSLPWERSVQAGAPRSTPWLALVLIAEGEAELKLNQPVAQCVTPGTTLSGKADTELGNYLQIRKSMVDRIFPTQLDVPLLAHAREVDIHDTELMMGDDDGFLAVVIANRLPLPGRDTNGDAVPVKYLACLVNLEGQFLDLLERAPEPARFTSVPIKYLDIRADQATWDHAQMGRYPAAPVSNAAATPTTMPTTTTAAKLGPTIGSVVGVPSAAASPYAPPSTWSTDAASRGVADVYAEMAQDFRHAAVSGFVAGAVISLDPTMRFPVLLHWSFTSYGATTFRSLMEGLDSGLLGTVPEDAQDETGRLPLEVVETGHTGLAHRTRRGDSVRSWYRGPFVAHPTIDPPTGRLPLAHSADQLRIVVPDGREDISLAAAFEIGRLLALARPAMVAALLRWRQTGYQTLRREAVWSELRPFLDAVLPEGDRLVDSRLGVHLGRGLVDAVIARPQDFLGDPRPPVDAGRPLTVDSRAEVLLGNGFGFKADVLTGDPSTVLDRLRDSTVLRPMDAAGPGNEQIPLAEVRRVLSDALTRQVDALVTDAVVVRRGVGTDPGVAVVNAPDLLGRLFDDPAAEGEAQR
jgi:hypothetical protein